MIALASRSKSAPVVLRTSQPRPTMTAVRPGASLLSETLPPLLRLTPTFSSCDRGARTLGACCQYLFVKYLFVKLLTVRPRVCRSVVTICGEGNHIRLSDR